MLSVYVPAQLYINFIYALTLELSTDSSTHCIDKIMCTTNDQLCTMMKPGHFIGNGYYKFHVLYY